MSQEVDVSGTTSAGVHWELYFDGEPDVVTYANLIDVIALLTCQAEMLRNKTGPVMFSTEADLPAWEELRGRAPDATGNLSSEAFVRELRDGWR